jgi:hypothetical protein
MEFLQQRFIFNPEFNTKNISVGLMLQSVYLNVIDTDINHRSVNEVVPGVLMKHDTMHMYGRVEV